MRTPTCNPRYLDLLDLDTAAMTTHDLLDWHDSLRLQLAAGGLAWEDGCLLDMARARIYAELWCRAIEDDLDVRPARPAPTAVKPPVTAAPATFEYRAGKVAPR